ncbi:Alpha/beta hydrolase fold-3 domain-containing protein [Methylophaga lonarensis MPL]|uniref:Alpha/beta hydrolase fold-3 domain-containing protein n=1 Tax=Methylophaga lonarensis MPL TaxID=1286106 RepID=M7PJF9_9GAMM|nr:alpha/beta hydrolase [Methylophaga lonarensis]EMR14040.1 Alpha/beta hydrolase fold-3 domain-containing protein [Methylophaga lonarensis MPL]
MPTVRLKSLTAALGSLLLTACSPINALNAMVPSHHYSVQTDIAYGKHHRQQLDVYQPEAAAKALPVVVFFYGGSWSAGNRQDYKFVAEALVSEQMLVVVPDYRVYPEVGFPVFVEDAAAAVAWVINNIADFGGDADQVFVAGHSAGAHIAALVSLDNRYLAQHQLQPTQLSGMIGLAGPYDFLPLTSAKLKRIFADEQDQWQSQPINFVDAGHPPMLLMVGGRDRTVLPRNSHRLADRITQGGGDATLMEFERYGHVAMVAKLAKPFRGSGELLQPMADFVHQRPLTYPRNADANRSALPKAASTRP